jgi:hypothetical protein
MILLQAAEMISAIRLLAGIALRLDVITRVGPDGCKSATRATSVELAAVSNFMPCLDMIFLLFFRSAGSHFAGF